MRYGSSPLTTVPSLWGGYSHYMYLHPNAVIHRVRDDVPAHHLAMAIPMSNGVQWTQYEAGLRMGQSVLIQGPGQQGLAAVTAAKRLGADNIIVSGLTRDAARFEIAKKFGAHHVIDVEREDLLETVYALTDGEGADAVLDLAGGHSFAAVETAIELISSGDYPVELMATHQFGLDEVDLGIRSIGGEGVDGSIHVSIIPPRPA